ncbi:virulence RhuM family protein [Chryseobacterium gambrini]|uniref:virulence RhuM family protein n=1 Tax=Chryseobacterium gambrini TaxID=373672 RepID=UPI000ECCB478|nr:virulence RhuM family protein [Chryseobacterium gambrini]WBX99598.1 virulence RhuM family protein [Chryseobacterium gambrini]HCR77013.1 cell filamentation protein Fic [Chryseobacterium sp.]
MKNNLDNLSNFIFYQTDDGKISVQVFVDNESETIWASQKAMSEIFDINVSGITKHLKNIFEENELSETGNVQKLHIANSTKPVNFYSLDVIISVGYRINSYKATQFRRWATSILKEYLIKGFVLDEERLKQGNQLFGKDYFAELLERIREIRASERLFYQKITDIYATSVDYDLQSPITKEFYATVQNKLHWAIHNHTAAELIKLRASANKPNMGLTSWKNEKKGGKILKTDVSVAKNYLNEEELGELNRVVTMYLDFAENMAKRQKEMKMVDWIARLDSFLSFNEYDVLKDSGKVSATIAKRLAENEYEKFRIIQDKEYKSDFDKVIEEIRVTGNVSEKAEPNKQSLENLEKNDDSN